MFTLMLSSSGLLALDDFPKGVKTNSQYFYDIVLGEIRQAILTIPKKSGTEKRMIRMDNCQAHDSAKVMKNLEELQITWQPYPPYSAEI
jgi:hypothetical protein